VENYIAFLVIGVFIFTYTNKSIRQGASSIVNNISLVRALHFPRALLPVSTVIEELLALGPSLIVCAVVVLVTGEGIHWAWLLLVPALVLQTMFNTGMVFVFARMTERVRDVAKLLPFMLRTWFYVSGVVFPIGTVITRAPDWVSFLLQFNPGAVFVELARDALLESYTVPPITWVYAVFWGFFALIVGFVYFWKAEEKYGRG
jgi:teichoic acid transport system permease protein